MTFSTPSRALIAAGLLAVATASWGAPRPRVYTAEELATTVPDEPNPYLAFLPAEATPDWSYWRARVAYDGQQRALRHAQQQRRTGPVITATEAEPPMATGLNDLPSYGEPLTGFGSRVGQTPRARITGTVRPLPTVLDLGTPGGAIPSASLVPVASGARVALDGIIGDSPFGSGGSGTGDFDVYRLRVEAGQRVEMLVRTPEPLDDLDPVVGLYAADGTLLAVNDNLIMDGFLENLDSYLAYVAPTDGDLYVAVAGKTVLDPGQDETDLMLADPFDPASGPGVGSEGDYQVMFALDARDPMDVDYFQVSLRAGDVLGVTTNGDARRVSIAALDGTLLIESRIDASGVFPEASPLPGGGDATAAYVIDTAGTYAVGVRGADAQGIGPYTLDLTVTRGRLDQVATRASQIVFVDFDGATFDGTVFGRPPGPITLSPLAAYLAGWGLGNSDENRVIDAILTTVARQLDDDIGVGGRNGDFDDSGIVGQFDVILRNSRDHPDPGADPLVSRVIVGGSISELGIPTIGLAQSIDPGNFATAETAVVLLDLLSAPDPKNPNSLNSIPRATGIDIVALIGAGVGSIVSHETGHLTANFHTRRDQGPPVVMDRGGDLPNLLGVGEDGIWGSADDQRVAFALDGYTPVEGLAGDENTLNAVAFALARGGPRPDLALDAVRLDFGPVPVGQSRTLDLALSNEGSEPLTGSVSLTTLGQAGTFSIEAGGGAFTVAAGARTIVSIRFVANTLGTATGSLIITSTDGDQPAVTVPLSGQAGVPSAAASPTSIAFGALEYGDATTTITRTLTVTNSGPGMLTVASLDRTGPDAGAFVVEPDPSPFTVPTGGQRDLSVRFRPGGPVGAMDALLRIRSNAPNAPLDVPLSGVAFGPDIDVVPGSPYFFPVTRIGDLRDITFTVFNLGSRPLDVDSAVLAGKNPEAFAIVGGATPFVLDPGASTTLDLRFAPLALGEATARLELLGNDPDEAPFQLLIGGLGVLPVASVTPSSVDFGDVPIGITRFQALDIANDGNGRLFVQPPELVGPNADRFRLSVNSLFFVDPGEVFRLLARFTPDAAGSFQATLRLETDDPDRPLFEIPFRGTGAPAALDLNKACAGPSAPSCTIVVTNVGPGDATGTVVRDELPDGVVWLADDCGAGPPTGASWVWAVGTLVEGEARACTLQLAATDDAPPVVINVATATTDATLPGDEATATAPLPLRGITEIPTVSHLGAALLAILLAALATVRLRTS